MFRNVHLRDTKTTQETKREETFKDTMALGKSLDQTPKLLV